MLINKETQKLQGLHGFMQERQNVYFQTKVFKRTSLETHLKQNNQSPTG